MTEREQFEQTSTDRLAKRIRDILGSYNDDTEALNLISKLVLEREEYFDRIGQLEQAARATPQIPEGMVLVPVERTFESGALAFKELMIEATHAAIHPHIEGVYGVFEHRLAAAKENQ